ncbi:MAG: two-component sensor histidine kinase [Cyclobacterium sp.]|nr:two-component sensor histidine kinase [Cyclobacterium sp.]
MKIQLRITLLFTALSAAILLVFMLLIYFFSSQNRTEDFFNTIEAEAVTKVSLLKESGLSPEILQTLYKNNRDQILEVEVAIYNQNFALLYHDDVEVDLVKETDSLLQEIRDKGKVRWKQQELQVSGFVHPVGSQTYLVTAAALDRQGFKNLDNLKNTMAFLGLGGIVFLYLIGRYFSKKSLEPVGELSAEAQKITAKNLHLRLREGPDEIGQLAATFNSMLERLETSFQAQQQFVSYLGHEIQTPLAAIRGDLELTLEKNQSNPEIYHVLKSLLADSQTLSKLCGDLIDLAKANYDKSIIQFAKVSMEALILDLVGELLRQQPEAKIHLSFEEKEDEFPQIMANPYLLSIAIKNLLENSLKYSSNGSCQVILRNEEKCLVLQVKDQGIGIPEEDQQRIFEPFYRGKNKGFAKGTGVGLTLVKRIADLHKTSISIDSEIGMGTTVTIRFPIG